MHFNYTITEDEYIEFNLDYISRSKIVKKELNNYRLLYILFGIIVCIFGFIIFKDDITLAIIFISFNLVYIIYRLANMKKRYFKNVVRRIKKMLSNGAGEKTIGKKEFEIIEDKMHYTSDGEVSEIDIKKIKYLRETENTILLYRDDISAFIISKSAFTDNNDIEIFKKKILSEINIIT